MNIKLLGRALRLHREAARLTIDDVAESSGVAPKRVKRLEDGDIDEPDFRSVVDVGRALGLSPNTLVEIASRPPRPQSEQA